MLLEQTNLYPNSSDSCAINDDVSDCSSVDTGEAFLEMLGLTSLDLATSSSPSWENCDDDDNAKCNNIITGEIESKSSSEMISGQRHDPMNRRLLSTSPNFRKITPINLPKRVSRHHYAPSSCLALVVDNILSPLDCKNLIEIAKNFRYITEATHKTADGSSYTVQIQNPNPHKLAVIDTRHSPYASSSHSTQLDDFATSIMDHLYYCICDVLTTMPKQKQSKPQDSTSFEIFLSRERCGSPKGLNPRMRILKYDARDNDRFDPHFDATTYVPASQLNSTPTLSSSAQVVDAPSLSSNEYRNGIDEREKRLKSLITVLVYLNDGAGGDFEGGETLYLDYDATATSSTTQDVEKITPKAGRVVLFEHDLFHSGAPLSWGTKYVMRTDILFDEETTKEEDISCATKTGHCNSNQINTNINSSTKLLHEVCDELNLSLRDKQILDEMGLLNNITCESFLSPGITPLKLMLVDGGLEENNVNCLIKKAHEVTKSR